MDYIMLKCDELFSVQHYLLLSVVAENTTGLATHRCINVMHTAAVLCEQKWRKNVPKVTKVTENASQTVGTSLHALCP